VSTLISTLARTDICSGCAAHGPSKRMSAAIVIAAASTATRRTGVKAAVEGPVSGPLDRCTCSQPLT